MSGLLLLVLVGLDLEHVRVAVDGDVGAIAAVLRGDAGEGLGSAVHARSAYGLDMVTCMSAESRRVGLPQPHQVAFPSLGQVTLRHIVTR